MTDNRRMYLLQTATCLSFFSHPSGFQTGPSLQLEPVAYIGGTKLHGEWNGDPPYFLGLRAYMIIRSDSEKRKGQPSKFQEVETNSYLLQMDRKEKSTEGSGTLYMPLLFPYTNTDGEPKASNLQFQKRQEFTQRSIIRRISFTIIGLHML